MFSTATRSVTRRLRRRRTSAFALVLASGWVAQRAGAQTDYYNTDAGHPVRIEDAYPTERYAFELQLAPVRLERASGGIYTWGLAAGLGYGLLPRTHVELAVPIMTADVPEGSRAGVAGLEISSLYNLNTETAGMPAFGIAAHALLPVGEFGPDRVFPSVAALATRTFTGLRIHANAQYTVGDEAGAGNGVELSRWLAGIAVDRAFPLRSFLITAETFAEQPLDSRAALAWTVGAGFRKQRSPRLAIDAGIGRRLTGSNGGWYLTAGAAYAFSIRALMPGRGR